MEYFERISQNLTDNWLEKSEEKSEKKSEYDDVSLSLWEKNMNSE